ncbi:MAG: peptidylprolyl isomerase [Acidobacteriota bacterium]|nr:peptidylprolyl isomerase [Acidobacteriota bacterium]
MIVGAVISAVAMAGCGERPVGPEGGEPSRIDRIGGREVTDAEFEIYLQRELGDASLEVAAAARRRLYEEFIAELLFARAGEREGLDAPAGLVEEEMLRLREAGIEANDDELRLQARRTLLARAYEREVLLPGVSVPPEEVERELGAPLKRQAREFVVFRQIRAEDSASADLAYRRVVRQRESFEEVARELSTAPDRGALQQRALPHLPRVTTDVLRRLPEGSASRPVEVDGAFYVFQVVARNRDPDPGRVAERELVRLRLFQARLEQLAEERLAELAAREGIRVPHLVRDAEETGR